MLCGLDVRFGCLRGLHRTEQFEVPPLHVVAGLPPIRAEDYRIAGPDQSRDSVQPPGRVEHEHRIASGSADAGSGYAVSLFFYLDLVRKKCYFFLQNQGVKYNAKH